MEKIHETAGLEVYAQLRENATSVLETTTNAISTLMTTTTTTTAAPRLYLTVRMGRESINPNLDQNLKH